MSRKFESMILICTDCNEEFVFTAKAQVYFDHIGRSGRPKRCKFCYIASKQLERSLGQLNPGTA